MKETKKQKAKRIILKIVNIVSYVLASVFILVLFLGSCSPKSKDPNNNKRINKNLVETTEPYKWYQLREDSYEGLDVNGKVYDKSTNTLSNVDYIISTTDPDIISYGVNGQVVESDYTDTYFYLDTELDSQFLANAPITIVDKDINFDLHPRTYIGGQEDVMFTPSTKTTITIFNGRFSYNGQYYNKIKVTFTPALGILYGTTNKSTDTARWDTEGFNAYLFTQYISDTDNRSIMVHQATYNILDNGGNCYSGSYGWVSETFRNIHIDYYVNETNDSAYTSLTYYDLISMSPTQSGGSVTVNGNELLNIFTLIGMAFTSFSGLFNIGIGPGLTIGTFVLIPLVVIILVSVIKLLKK